MEPRKLGVKYRFKSFFTVKRDLTRIKTSSCDMSRKTKSKTAARMHIGFGKVFENLSSSAIF